MRQKKIIIVTSIVVVLAIILCFLNIFTIRKKKIESDFSHIYGVQCKVTTIDKEKTTGAENVGYKFLAETDTGFSYVGLCDYWGNISEESYSHYYYASDVINSIDVINDDLLSESVIFEDMENNSDIVFATEPTDKTKTYEDYCLTTQSVEHLFKVYVKDSVDEGTLEKLLEMYDEAFAENDYTIMVWKVSAEMFDISEGLNVLHKGNSDIFNGVDGSDSTLLAEYNNHGVTRVK